MSSAYPILPSRPVIPHITLKCPRCSVQLEFPLPEPTPPTGSVLQVRCFQCQGILKCPYQPANIPPDSAGPSKPSTPPLPRRGRKIGTQENPLETGYYDILGVTVSATDDDIKKAYRRLAIKHHPDKNRDDPHAEERFKEIAVAYQTLSDPVLRKKYNEFGPKESAPEGGFVDPEEVFSAIFGGDRFVPIIGEISLGRDMKVALQEAENLDEEGNEKRVKDAKGNDILTPEEKAKKEEKARKVSAEKAAAREERVKKLVETLERKLSIFTESATGPNDRDVTESWRTICGLEAEELKKESYGIELLHAVGFVYASKARHYLASNQSFLGVGGWLHNVQGKYHVFSETMSTLKAAIELKSVFDQIQAAEKAGNLSPEEKKKLEEQAAEKGLQALFKGTKLEVESVLRETCDRVLANPNITPQKAHLRAVALQILGDAYSRVRKEGEASKNEFVLVGTKQSRDRESRTHASSGSTSTAGQRPFSSSYATREPNPRGGYNT